MFHGAGMLWDAVAADYAAEFLKLDWAFVVAKGVEGIVLDHWATPETVWAWSVSYCLG